MPNKIIKIDPVPEHFSITWEITSNCNYDCMYCPSRLHDNSKKHLTLEQMQQYWLSIYEKSNHTNLKYKLSVTGGEAASNKDLLPFLKWLSENYGSRITMILLSSNGSMSTSRYKKLFQYVSNLTLTLHSEHVNEIEFFNKVNELKEFISDDSRVLHVDVMDEFFNKERIPMYQQILSSINVPYSINSIKYDVGTRDYPIFKGNLNLDLSYTQKL